MSATYGLDFERQIPATSLEVRQAIAAALRELGFQITVEQMTRVEAKRGGMLGMSLMMKKQMPVLAVLEISAGESGCTIVTHLTDNIKSLGKTWGMNRQYREIFDEVQGRVDLGLSRLDGAAAESFAEPRFWSRAGSIGVLEQTNVLTAKAVGSAVGAAGKVLDGSASTTPKVWKGVDSVTFTSSAGVAVLTLAETQARLGVAVMIVSHPGSMPPNLTRDVEALAAAVETKLAAAGGKAAQVEVPDARRPVFEFLDQQAEIRSGLPLRQLHICRSCRLEKITNPEYERITTRNEKIGDIVAGVGATIGKGGISPTFVLGQVFKLKKLDPAYVCSRCQGMEADERVVTFCPKCADLARDVVLRICPKCKFDYRTRAGKTPLWAELPVAPVAVEPVAGPLPSAPAAAELVVVALPPAPVPAPAEQVVVAPTAAAAPLPATPAAAPPRAWTSPAEVPLGRPPLGQRGKLCQTCHREHPTLWRVVISTPAGFEERFICGTTFACQMFSLVPAVAV